MKKDDVDKFIEKAERALEGKSKKNNRTIQLKKPKNNLQKAVKKTIKEIKEEENKFIGEKEEDLLFYFKYIINSMIVNIDDILNKK